MELLDKCAAPPRAACRSGRKLCMAGRQVGWVACSGRAARRIGALEGKHGGSAKPARGGADSTCNSLKPTALQSTGPTSPVMLRSLRRSQGGPLVDLTHAGHLDARQEGAPLSPLRQTPTAHTQRRAPPVAQGPPRRRPDAANKAHPPPPPIRRLPLPATCRPLAVRPPAPRRRTVSRRRAAGQPQSLDVQPKTALNSMPTRLESAACVCDTIAGHVGGGLTDSALRGARSGASLDL